jgi:predicted dehydrogenase
MDTAGVGIVGCGAISDVYFEAGDTFAGFDIVACADLDAERAEEQASTHGVRRADDTDDLLADPEVDVVVNLTPPAVHADVSMAAVKAGNHVYTEKPLAASTDEARDLLDAAGERGLLVGGAPDTVLGRGLQTARRVIDEGRIGDPIGATAFVVSGGHESWHPNPDLFYRRGGGPLFDMGPYYLTALVNLLGPVTRVAGSTSRPFERRTITSEPRRGETIDIEVPTHECGVADFGSGATASLLFTFDVPASDIAPQQGFEVHGTEGTLRAPDPNGFGGPVEVRTAGDGDWETVPLVDGPSGQQRGMGVADLVAAAAGDWSHRTSGRRAYHVLEAMEGLRTASDESDYRTPEQSVSRPDPMPAAFPASDG